MSGGLVVSHARKGGEDLPSRGGRPVGVRAEDHGHHALLRGAPSARRREDLREGSFGLPRVAHHVTGGVSIRSQRLRPAPTVFLFRSPGKRIISCELKRDFALSSSNSKVIPNGTDESSSVTPYMTRRVRLAIDNHVTS